MNEWIFKFVGAVLVMLATGGTGIYYSQKFQQRPREIRELLYILNVLENEMAFMSRKLPDAFQNISSQMTYPMESVFRETAAKMKSRQGEELYITWNNEINKVSANSSLRNDDLEIMSTLGHTLGRTDIEGQVRCIRLAISQLKNQELCAMETAKKYGANFRNLGILLGLGIVILLI